MKNSGAAPVLFGACLASTAIHQCSCFTASPRVSVVSSRRPSGSPPHTFLRRSNSARLLSKRPSSATSSPTAAAASGAAAAAGGGDGDGGHSRSGRGKSTFDPSASTEGTRRRHQKARRRTLLSGSAGDSSSSSSSTVREPAAAADQQQQQQPLTTSQQLRAEVAARRSRAWGLVGFPPPPAGGFDGQGLGLPAPWGDDETRRGAGLVTAKPAAFLGEDAADDATDGGRQRDCHDDDERRRLLDMTQPPPELLTAAETRSIDDRRAAAPTAAASSRVSSQQEKQPQENARLLQGAGEEEGVSLWASRGMLAGAAMLYGTNFGCVKLLEESVPMSLAAALRFSVALVPFVPFLRKVNPGVFRAGAEVGLLNAIGYWAQSESLMTTTASKSAFICSLAVVFVPVLDALLGAKDTPEAASAKALEKTAVEGQGGGGGGVFAAMNGPWFPALLAAAGVACLELIGAEGGANSGDVWALVQPLCFGLGFWLTERCSRKYPDEIFGLVAAQLLTVAVLAVAWCFQAGDVPLSLASLRETVLPSSGNLAVPISLMWTGLVTTSLTVFGETLAMKKVSAAESTIILSTEPIWGTAFAAVLLGETIGWNTGLGALLIVSACTWTSVGPALQTKLLSLMAAAAGAGTAAAEAGIVDVDDLADTVGTVLKEIVSE